MNAHNFGGNPYDNQEFLADKFRKLTPEQQVAAFLAVAERYHREKCSREDLAGNLYRVNQQYERALVRISTLQKELQERAAPDTFQEAA